MQNLRDAYSGGDPPDFPLSSPEPQPDFRAILESAPSLLLILSPDLRVVAVSNSYLRATRTVREQIVGRRLADIFPENPDDPNAAGVRRLVRASLNRVLRDKIADAMAVQRADVPRPESEGGGFEERYWSTLNAPVMGEDGNVKYVIHRVENVTDFVLLKQKRAEEQKASEELRTVASRLETELYLRARELDSANQDLRAANQKLAQLYGKAQESDQVKSHFFANVSHELRTPLTLVLSPLEELLKKPGASVPVDRSDLELMRRNSLRLLRLVNTLLDLARIEAGRLRGDYVPADLAVLTAECASLFQSVVETAGLWFRLDLELGEAVYVDQAMWEKIVLNLLSNAFKFTLQGGITVALRKVDGCAQLKVMDTGVGIPEEELPHIFERFHRSKGARGRTFEGTGIGLALADELVKLHGGAIGVESIPGRGTTFTVSIPIAARDSLSQQILPGEVGITPTARAAYAVEAEMWAVRGGPGLEPQAAAPEAGISREPCPGEGRPRVVFADDNADMRAYLTRLLGGQYDLETVNNGEQALAAIRNQPPDLVLSDVMMPVMDGLQLLRELRDDPRTRTVPVVLLSARAQEDSRIDGLEAGADDYLYKPFTARELIARVRSQITLAKLRKEAEERLSGLNLNLEERIRERTALMLAREELLQTFVRYVPAAVAMLDREMRYLQVSDRWCADYSLRADEILGRSHYQVFPDLPERWKAIHRRCLAGETLRADEDCWERPVGGQTWLRWEIRPWGEKDGKPEGILIFSEDITGRKHMEATLRESEATLRTLLDTAAQAILAVDASGTVILANRMAEEMFGFGRGGLLGTPLEMLLPERLRERHVSHRTEFGNSPRSRPMGIGLELQGLRRDGTEFPIEVSLSTVNVGRETLAVAFVTDITKRKEAETALRGSERVLRALARSLLTAQEDERRRVARDLHDDITQRLALQSIEIGRLAAELPSPAEEIRERFRSLQHNSMQVSNELRRLSHGLHPSLIEDFGLSTALREFCEEFAKAQGINLSFECPATDAGLSGDGASCLYRIAQECLRNAAKHARATEIEVRLTNDGANVQLVVRDNGVGFPADRERVGPGLGLVSMRERITMANGVLSIHSQPGLGTEIVASVPLSGA